MRDVRRAARLRAMPRDRLSSANAAWLDAYKSLRMPGQPTASIAELVGAVTIAADCDPSDLRTDGSRQPAWRDEARRTLMLAMRRARYNVATIAATVGQPYRAACRSIRRAARDATNGKPIAARMAAVALQIDRARRGEALPRKASAKVAARGDTIAVSVRVGSAAWRYLDRLAEFAELSEITSARKSARDAYITE